MRAAFPEPHPLFLQGAQTNPPTPCTQANVPPALTCVVCLGRTGGKGGATQSGRCSVGAVMWHAVQHGDLYVLCGVQWELNADVVPRRRCVACVACGVAWGRCGTTRARSCGHEGGSLKQTAVHHQPGVSHSTRPVMCKSGFSVASPCRPWPLQKASNENNKI